MFKGADFKAQLRNRLFYFVGDNTNQFTWLITPEKPTSSCCCDAQGVLQMTSPSNAKGVQIDMTLNDNDYFNFHISHSLSDGYGKRVFFFKCH